MFVFHTEAQAGVKVTYTKEELDDLEFILNLSMLRNEQCCADMGICSHDAEFIEKKRQEITR